MRLIYSKLGEEENIFPVWFNAWRYEREKHPIIPLIATILCEINNQSRNGGFDEFSKDFKDALKAILFGLTIESEIDVPLLAKLGIKFDGKKFSDKVKEITSDPIIDQSLYYNIFDILNSIDIGKKKIVIIIDDLDRCLPDYAVKLLEGIKLLLSQPNFIIIIGVSRMVIEGFLEHRYKVEFGVNGFDGKSYLDKIIQLPFNIPSHHERVEKFLSDLILEIPDLKERERNQFTSLQPLIGYISADNPRAIIRFMNNLLIDRAINQKLVSLKRMKEIPITFFALTRCMQQRWRNTYALLFDNRDLCNQLKNKLLNPNNNDELKGELKIVIEQINQDENLEKLIKSNIGQNWLSSHAMRVSTEDFLMHIRSEEDIRAISSADVIIFTPSLDSKVFLLVKEVFNSSKYSRVLSVVYEKEAGESISFKSLEKIDFETVLQKNNSVLIVDSEFPIKINDGIFVDLNSIIRNRLVAITDTEVDVSRLERSGIERTVSIDMKTNFEKRMNLVDKLRDELFIRLLPPDK